MKRFNITTNANTPETLAAFKAFYKEAKSAPEFLHNYAGFDFLKPFKIAEFETPTTYRKIFEALNIPESGNGWRVFAFFPSFYSYYDKKVIELLNIYSFDIDIQPYKHTKDRCPDYFYRKSDAESARKQNGQKITIIAQKTEHITTPTTRGGLDFSERYNLKKVNCFRFDNGGKDYIRELKLTDRKTGVKIDYKIQGQVIYRPEAIPADDLRRVIDKSGYIIQEKITDLKRRAAALRAERLKAQADATDATKTAAELLQLFNDLKTKTAEALKQAQTAEDINTLADICGRWSGLPDLFNDLARFTTKASEKTFISPEAITKAADNIKAKAQTLTEKLNALSVAGV